MLAFAGTTVAVAGTFVVLLGIIGSVAPLPDPAGRERLLSALILLGGVGMVLGGPNTALGSRSGALFAAAGTAVVMALLIFGAAALPEAPSAEEWWLLFGVGAGAALLYAVLWLRRSHLTTWGLCGPAIGVQWALLGAAAAYVVVRLGGAN